MHEVRGLLLVPLAPGATRPRLPAAAAEGASQRSSDGDSTSSAFALMLREEKEEEEAVGEAGTRGKEDATRACEGAGDGNAAAGEALLGMARPLVEALLSGAAAASAGASAGGGGKAALSAPPTARASAVEGVSAAPFPAAAPPALPLLPPPSGTRLLIIVPYRDQPQQNRSEQLRRFAAAMPAFLASAAVQPPLSSFHILVIEQSEDGCKFNRGKALNVGMRLALGDAGTGAGAGANAGAGASALLPPAARGANALCLHDVDLLPGPALGPLYARVPGARPLHIGGAWKRYDYENYVGGVITLSAGQARALNGFPNSLWGWGGEDDCLYARMAPAGLPLPPERPPPAAAGALVDLEEELIAARGGARAGTSARAGGNNDWRNLVKREQVREDRRQWREEGLSSCEWRTLATRSMGEHVTILTVDLLGARDPLASAAAQTAEMERLLALEAQRGSGPGRGGPGPGGAAGGH